MRCVLFGFNTPVIYDRCATATGRRPISQFHIQNTRISLKQGCYFLRLFFNTIDISRIRLPVKLHDKKAGLVFRSVTIGIIPKLEWMQIESIPIGTIIGSVFICRFPIQCHSFLLRLIGRQCNITIIRTDIYRNIPLKHMKMFHIECSPGRKVRKDNFTFIHGITFFSILFEMGK